MKRITAIALFSTASIITLGSAFAQSRTVEAKIPFAFVVRKQVLPAGTYRISSVGTNLVEIGTRDKRVLETATTYASNSGLENNARLVFAQYGNQYFLREILCESATINAELPASSLEKQTRIQVARLRSIEQSVAGVR